MGRVATTGLSARLFGSLALTMHEIAGTGLRDSYVHVDCSVPRKL